MFPVRTLKTALRLPTLLCILVLLDKSLAYRWPSPQYDALERFIYEGSRDENVGMFELLRNCGRRVFTNNDPDEDKKSTVAAQWLRVAYHDMATHNITDKTGGLDGSIHFEVDRAENIGDGMTITLAEYNTFPNKYITRADVIAFGAAFAVADCGGPLIPLSGGRVDAIQKGPPGVPEPQQDLQTHTEKFRLQGFNSTEMIELVACGHTLGGVESEDFPHIVPPPLPVGSSNFSSPFDRTPKFDTAVVSEYLDNTTLNPLVVGHNGTTRSDLRIFNSDGNVTMKALAKPAVFRERCTTLLGRMIDTVPAGVQLTERIDLLSEKPYEASLRFLGDRLTFFTTLRLARPVSEPFTDRSTVSLYWCDRYGDNANCKLGSANKIKGANDSPLNAKTALSPMTKSLGMNLRYYTFQAPIDAVRSISYFWYQVEHSDGSSTLYDNKGDKYPVVQDSIISPSHEIQVIGSEVLANNSFMVTRFVVGAVRTELKPSRVYARVIDRTHNNKPIGDMDFIVNLSRNTTLPSVLGYDSYSGQFNIVGTGTSVDLVVDTMDGKTSVLDFQSSELDLHLEVPVGVVQKVPYTGRVQSSAVSMGMNVQPQGIRVLVGFLMLVGVVFV